MSRDPARIERICEVLRGAWEQFPDERLGQLLLNAIGHDANVWETEDDVWEDELWGRIAVAAVRNHRAEKRAKVSA